jgi:hypothetical protein
MENITELATATYAALIRDYYLWIGILSLVLAFALYVYFFPTSIDFFTGSQPSKPKSTELPEIDIRSEPVESDAATGGHPTG